MTNEELNAAADAAMETINETASKLAEVRQVISIKMGLEAELAWSGKRHGGGYKWRLVVRYDNEIYDHFSSLSREERIEIAETCARLIERAVELGALGKAQQRQAFRRARSSA